MICIYRRRVSALQNGSRMFGFFLAVVLINSVRLCALAVLWNDGVPFVWAHNVPDWILFCGCYALALCCLARTISASPGAEARPAL